MRLFIEIGKENGIRESHVYNNVVRMYYNPKGEYFGILQDKEYGGITEILLVTKTVDILRFIIGD